MVEQELEITVNGQYNNINLKPKPLKGMKGLEDGNHIVVKKLFAEGFEVEPKNPTWKPSYSCKAEYLGKEVTFWLTQKEHDSYKVIGGVDDSVKITLKKEGRVNPKTGIESVYPILYFEAA